MAAEVEKRPGSGCSLNPVENGSLKIINLEATPEPSCDAAYSRSSKAVDTEASSQLGSSIESRQNCS